jgi:hypothetical protein
MTEQTPQDKAREGEKKRPEPRDAAYWAQYAETLMVAGAAEGATNINVEGRRAGPDSRPDRFLRSGCAVSSPIR